MCDTLSFFYYIHRKDLCGVVNILEAYEGLAIVRTLDRHSFLNEVQVPASRKGLFLEVMKDLEKKGLVKECRDEHS